MSSLHNLKISYPTKYPKYQKGDSFARYCEKFQEHVLISNKSDPNLYIHFLQNVDDETYAKLKLINLTADQKTDAASFCALYKTAIYGSQQVQLINEVRDCRQESDESITDYAFKLGEKANIAHADPAIREQECYLTFLRGVHNKNIKRKLNESRSLNNFNEAVEYAKQLDTVEKRFSAENNATEVKSVLKESTATFDKADSKTPDNSRRDRSRSRSPAYHRKSLNNDRKSYNSKSFRSNDRERSQQPKRVVRCWTCNKIGHISRNCWHNPNRPQQGNNSWNYAQVPNQGPQHLN